VKTLFGGELAKTLPLPDLKLLAPREPPEAFILILRRREIRDQIAGK